MNALQQSKDTIHDLLSCGLVRKEFRVYTDTKRYQRKGVKVVEYGDAKIVLFCTIERCIELSPKLAEKFNVTQIIIDGEIKYILVENTGKIGLYKWDITKREQNNGKVEK